MSVASLNVRERIARPSFLERVLSAAPLLAIVTWLALVYAVQAAGHPSPTLFTDELQWTQFSRGVADDGVASIRGERVWFESLYVYLIAPAWWLGSTETAYEAIKYLNVLVMTSAAFPAYFLARRLVSKPASLAVAAASISIPPMVYALYVLTEVIAYPWAVLCVWLIVEALARRTRGWTAAAVAASLAAPLVRGALIVVPMAFAVAGVMLWWRGPRAARLRGSSWRRADTVALVLLGIGAFAILTRWLLHSNDIWRLAAEPAPSQIWLHGLWAIGALTIGLGVLPLVAGLAGLVPRRGELLTPHDRAFIALTASLIGLFAAYTGIKGAYNVLTFADRVDERNVFYLAPLLLLATAIALERRRIGVVPVAVAAAIAAYLVTTTPIQLHYPYFDAPGFSIATMTNRNFYWPIETIERALLVTLALSVAVLVGMRFARGPLARAGLALVAVALVAWNLTGQVTAAGGANATARLYLTNLPQPPDWVDRATDGATVIYLGQTITSGVGLRTSLLEFWNSSIVKVGTTDGSELFPGPTFQPGVVQTEGTLSNPPGTAFLLADSGIEPVGSPIDVRGSLRLYPLDGPIKLRESVEGVDEESWMGQSSAYNRFAEAGRGELVVTLSRSAFCPEASIAPPAPRVTVTVGPLITRDDTGQPGIGRLWATGERVVPNCKQRELRLPVEAAPWRAQVSLDETFKPADYGFPDTRILGVMVAFRFEPTRSP